MSMSGILARISFVFVITFALLSAGNLFFEHRHGKVDVVAFEPSVADVEALALNIYHETRGVRGPENIGWRSVAAVVFNRLADKRFPKTIPDVVYQTRIKRGKVTCEFSWYCDGRSDVPHNKKLYEEISVVARAYIIEYRSGAWHDPTRGAHSYHANTVKPNRYFQKLVAVVAMFEGGQGHFFYRDS